MSLKKEAACSSEKLVSTYNIKWYHNPEDHYLNTVCSENLVT
jgi:hypothetical protein